MQDDDFPAAVRRLRQARDLSFRELAALTNTSAGHLSHIEKRTRGWSHSVAAALDRALGADGALVALAEEGSSQDPLSAIPSEVMQRRMFLQIGLAASAAIGIPVPAPAPAAAGAAGIRRIIDETRRLHGLDHQHGGATLWRAAYALLGDSYELIRSGGCSGPLEEELLQATGRLHMCTGWLAFDAGRRDVAAWCYTEALSLSRETNDAELGARALMNLASCSTASGDQRQALRLAGAAADWAAHTDPELGIAVMPQLRRATAAAMAGDRAECTIAIGQARTALDRQPAPTQWNAFLTPAEVDGVAATCLVALGAPAEAVDLLQQTVATYPSRYARNRALYRVRLAQAHCDLNDTTAALTSANAAVDDLAANVGSARVDTEFERLVDQLRSQDADDALAVQARYAALKG